MTVFPRIAALSCLLVIVPACSPMGIATGVGAAGGIAAAQEGGLSRAYNDGRIAAKINDLWFRYDVETFRKLNLTVNQGRVLISGVVQDPQDRVEAVRLAWQPKGVDQVINEIRIAESGGISSFLKDTWISTQLRTKLTLDKEVQSVNYTIDTVEGTVYIMGVAQDQAELNHVIEVARTIPRVNQVISYVKLAGNQSDRLMREGEPYTDEGTLQADDSTGGEQGDAARESAGKKGQSDGDTPSSRVPGRVERYELF